MKSIPDKAKIEEYLGPASTFSVSVSGRVTSTNEVAKDAAKNGGAHFSVFVADDQTCGRGRLSRKFFSPGGTGIYMSIILRPDGVKDITMITSAAAVCMSEAIEETLDIRPEIKWVNDLLVNGKKVCGILTEASFSGGAVPDFVILGIGVNVFYPEGGFPPEISDIASSLLCEVTDEPVREKLIAAFLRRLEKRYAGIFSGEHMDEYRRRCHLPGSLVHVIFPDRTVPAKVCSVGDDCSLLVEYGDGTKDKIISGEISIKALEG